MPPESRRSLLNELVPADGSATDLGPWHLSSSLACESTLTHWRLVRGCMREILWLIVGPAWAPKRQLG